MSPPHQPGMVPGVAADERIADLICARATEGLDSAEYAEMHQRLGAAGVFAADAIDDVESYELAAAALCLAVMDAERETEPMPAWLAGHVVVQVERIARGAAAGEAPDAQAVVAPASRSGGNAVLIFGGWFAAAAAVAMAFIVAQRQQSTLLPPANADEVYSWLAARAGSDPGVSRAGWSTSAPDAPPIGGEVLWDGEHGVGTMTFAGLPANDPAVSQYQLWIFDAARPLGQFEIPADAPAILSQRPIAGGVFDSDGSASLIVPIDAALRVQDAKLFVITEEPPGGVVVSDRSRIVCIAQLS